jgi:hypothetical protein
MPALMDIPADPHKMLSHFDRAREPSDATRNHQAGAVSFLGDSS